METAIDRKFNLPPRGIITPNREGVPYASEIAVNPEAIGAQIWKSLLEDTQGDGKERACVVSESKFQLSKVFVGKAGGNGDVAHVITPTFPFGWRIFAPSGVHIHTHPMGTEESHLPTTSWSDYDIQNLQGYNAVVMVDRGGAHMLIPTISRSAGKIAPFPPTDLARSILNQVKKNKGTVADVQSTLAQQLMGYQIGSYFISSTDLMNRLPDQPVIFRGCI